MNLRAQLVRLDGNDGEAVNAPLAVVPSLSQAAEGELSALVDADVNGLLAASDLLPLVEAVGQDETAPLLVSLPEGGLAGDRLAACINKAVADLLVVSPEWD